MKQTDESRQFFIQHGYLNLGSVVDSDICWDLLKKIKECQTVSPDIFLSQEAFDKNPVYRGVNPMPGRNILENFPQELEEIESTDAIVSTLDQVLGNEFEILNKKVICGVPENWLPDWVLERIRENPVNNLGAYIKPELRNMTYFYGIDFHQDIIDWPGRELDFITLYVYLHDVGDTDAPLHLLEGSHALGVDQFPHDLKMLDAENNTWLFSSSVVKENTQCHYLTLTGKTGNVGLWHSCTLHGTQPNTSISERLSLRYLIRRLPNSKGAAIDEINQRLPSNQFQKDMRLDIDESGQTTLKKNYLFRQQKDDTI